jgi:N6-adenosine-specific RNA methylase IME4
MPPQSHESLDMNAYKIHPLADLFPFASEADFATLAQDISRNGLLEPIVLLDDAILDGRNRYRACANVGVEPRFVQYEGDDPLSYVVSKNLARRHLDESQRSMVAARIADMKEGRPSETAPIGTVSQEDAGQKLNVSRRSVGRAKKVLNSGDKDLINAVDSGQMSVSVAAKIADIEDPETRKEIINDSRPDQAVKKSARKQKERNLAKKQVSLPTKQYGVIYADPEWKFETFSDNGMDRSADNHYPTSSTDDICKRDVSSIAAKDCVLFLWATVPMLPDALKVMEAWGFTYKSQAVWVKDRIGTGYWFRNAHEILLIGTKGKVPAPAQGTQWKSVIEASVGAHSQKPEYFYDLIEEYFPNLPKIELNARKARYGWDAWGNEAPENE